MRAVFNGVPFRSRAAGTSSSGVIHHMSERLGAIPVLDEMSKGYHGKTVTLQPRNGRFPTHAAIEPPKALDAPIWLPALNAFPLTGAGRTKQSKVSTARQQLLEVESNRSSTHRFRFHDKCNTDKITSG
jgi:hypothetical protein